MHFQGREGPGEASLLPFYEGVAANERTSVEMHEAVEARFEGRVLDGELPGNEPVRLLDAKGVHRPDPEGAQVVIAARRHQPVEEVVLHLDGVVQLPAELADEVEAKGPDVGGADVDGAPGEPREVRVGEGSVGETLEEGARLGARDHEHPEPGGGRLEADAAVGREELGQRVEVVALVRPRRHEVEAVGRLAVHGELRAHPTVGGEEVAEPDPADPGGNAVREEAVEPPFGPRPGHLALRERAHVEEPCVLVYMAALGPHVIEPVGAPEAPHVLGLHSLRREPVGALPAIDLAEHRPERLHARVAGCLLEGSGGGALLVRIVNGEDVGVGLLVLLPEVPAGRIRSEAARVDAHHVDRRLALDDPLRDLPAGPARRGDPEAVALVEPEVGHVPGGPDEGAPIRGVGDGAVDRLLEADLAERGHPPDDRLDVGLEAFEVLGEEIVLEVVGGPVDEAGGGAAFIRPEKEAAPLLAEVVRGVRFPEDAHLRQPLLVTGDYVGVGLGDEVLVLHGDGGNVEPDHRPGLAGVVAGGAHHVLAHDVALVGAHPPLAAHGPLDGRHLGAAMDLRPPVAGAAGEGLGEVGGLNVAVLGVEDGADEAVRVAERPDRLDFVRGQELDADPDGARDPRIEPVLVHPAAVRREADVADRPEPDILPRLALELRVEPHRVLVDLPDAVAHVEQGEEPRRVPGGAGGELRALAKDHVRPALAGEVVERRDAEDAAADDDDPGMGLHGPTPACEKSAAP